MNTFKAKYPGTCAACAKRIEIDEMIGYVSSKEVYHAACDPEQQDLGDLTGPMLWIDTETGGLDVDNCAIVQIAAIATDENFLVEDSWSSLIRPGQFQTISERSIEVHGLTRERLQNEQFEDVVLPQFLWFCRLFPDHRFAGQNCDFDIKFLNKAYQRNHLSSAGAYVLPAYDTLPIARRKLGKQTKNHKLPTLAEHFGFGASAAHDALCDLYLTIQVARALQQLDQVAA